MACFMKFLILFLSLDAEAKENQNGEDINPFRTILVNIWPQICTYLHVG
jgi:hypothetical protein